MTDREYQIKNLSYIFDMASMSPCFKNNPKYPNINGSKRISYSDILNQKYIIRVQNPPKFTSFWDDTSAHIIASYDSIEALVDDGWRLG